MERKTKNDAALSGYYSATQFSSLMNINVSHIYQDLWNGRWKEFLLYQRRVAFAISSMLSLKYADRGQCNGGKPAAYPCGVIREHCICMKTNIHFHWDLW
ncbi:MAG: hypothetical protein ACLR78_01030 [Roseburia sp.]